MKQTKVTSILDDVRYLVEASSTGLWTPVCPVCFMDEDPVEKDYSGTHECAYCKSTFMIEGL